MGTRDELEARREWAESNNLTAVLADVALYGVGPSTAPSRKLLRMFDHWPGVFAIPLLDFLEDSDHATEAPRPLRKALLKHMDSVLRAVAAEHGIPFDPSRLNRNASEEGLERGAIVSDEKRVDANRLNEFELLTIARLADELEPENAVVTSLDHYDYLPVTVVEHESEYAPAYVRERQLEIIHRWRERLNQAARFGPKFERDVRELERSLDANDPLQPLYVALQEFRGALADGYGPSSPVFSIGSTVKLMEYPADGIMVIELESPAGAVFIRLHDDRSGPAGAKVECEQERSIELDLITSFYHGLLVNETGDDLTPIRDRVVAFFETRSWERTLDWLGSIVGEATTSDSEGTEPENERLLWGITVNSFQPITPVIQRRGKRGHWLKARKAKPRSLMLDCARNLEDRALLLRLQEGGNYFDDAQRIALDTLVGSDSLVDAEFPQQRVNLVRYRPRLRVESVRDGLALHIEQNDVALAVPDVEAAFGTGNGVDLGEAFRTRDYHLERETHLSLLRLPELGYVLVDWLAPFMSALEAFGESGRVYPRDAFAKLDPVLRSLESVLDVHWSTDESDDVRGPIAPAPQWIFRVSGESALRVRAFVQPHPGSGVFSPGEGSLLVPAIVEGELRLVQRSMEAEVDRVEELFRNLSGLDETLAVTSWARTLESLEELVPFLAECEEHDDVRVEWVELEAIRVYRPPQRLALSITSGLDWFDIQSETDAGADRITLAALVEARRRGESFVRLGKDNYLALTEEVTAQLALIEPRATVEGESVRIPSSVGLAILDDGLDPADLERADEALREQAARVRALKECPPSVPEDLRAELRSYQREGYRWLAAHGQLGTGAILADDMGLGKTIQALGLLLERKDEGLAIVVCPTSVVDNWCLEAGRFAPSLDFVRYRGEGREQVLEALSPGSVLVVSYGVLLRDSDMLAETEWATAILDEAQNLKNARAKTARAALALKRRFTVALSGTPIENHVGDLWSLMRLCVPTLLGSWKEFSDRFAKPIQAGSTDRRDDLGRLLRPFLLRRTKAEVARELPDCEVIEVPIHLSAHERKLYEQVRAHALSHLTGEAKDSLGEEKKRFEVLGALTRLRRATCHPALVDDRDQASSSKLVRLVEMCGELASVGRSALIFSQFTSFLAHARTALDKAGLTHLYLDGGTPGAERAKRVARFQDGEAPFFLISLKAGGVGLNLTRADTVIHLDPWWNPAVEQQATDRAHRIGQEQHVTVFRFFATETVEEKVMRLQQRKRELVSSILDGEASGSTPDIAQLLELLGAAGAGET